VLLNGRPLAGRPPADIARDIGIVFQNPNDQFFKSRVRDEIGVGLKLLDRDREQWFAELCRLFQLKGLLQRPPQRLSEGQKKRVALASVLAFKPKLLVLDEPTAGQDGRCREQLAALIGARSRQGGATLVVTHDLDFGRAVAERWIVLHNGALVADAPARTCRRDRTLVEMGALPPFDVNQAAGEPS
jgi:energy-coupling factor transport system ATP-binding protein